MLNWCNKLLFLLHPSVLMLVFIGMTLLVSCEEKSYEEKKQLQLAESYHKQATDLQKNINQKLGETKKLNQELFTFTLQSSASEKRITGALQDSLLKIEKDFESWLNNLVEVSEENTHTHEHQEHKHQGKKMEVAPSEMLEIQKEIFKNIQGIDTRLKLLHYKSKKLLETLKKMK